MHTLLQGRFVPTIMGRWVGVLLKSVKCNRQLLADIKVCVLHSASENCTTRCKSRDKCGRSKGFFPFELNCNSNTANDRTHVPDARFSAQSGIQTQGLPLAVLLVGIYVQ